MFLITLLAIGLSEDSIFNLRDFRIPESGETRLSLYTYISLPWGQSSFSDNTEQEFTDIKVAYYHLGIPWSLRILAENKFVDLYLAPYSSGSYRSWVKDFNGVIDSTFTRINPDIGVGLNTYSFSGLYIGRTPFFAAISDTLNSGFWYDSYDNGDISYTATTKGVYGSLFFGPGIGRIRNVTSVIHAWQFLDEIGKANHDNVETLAGLLARKYTYSLKYSRYEKYFYQDLEKLLQEKGIVSELSTYDLMRLREIVATMQPGRLSGVRLWSGVGGNGEITSRVGTDTSFLRTYLDKGIQINLEAGYPLTRRWQLSGKLTADIITPDWNKLENHVRGEGQISYYLTDRWKLSLGLEGRRWDESQTTPSIETGNSIFDQIIISAAKGWWFDIPLGVTFYLEDNLYIYGNAGYAWTHREYPNYDGSIYDHSGFFAETGFTWRLR